MLVAWWIGCLVGCLAGWLVGLLGGWLDLWGAFGSEVGDVLVC